jgi:uncharacterized SAM-binding protein YcdF (DUF218 family)
LEEEPLMFFILSKTVALLLVPSNLLLLIGAIGLVLLFTRRQRTGRWIVAASLVLFLIIGFLPVGSLLGHALESRFPPWDPSRGPPDGIIVLGSAIDPDLSQARGQTALNGSAERVTVIAKLARAYPKARIVYSSGNASLFNGPAEADYVMPLLESFGIPATRVSLETRSRNTYENALFSKALIKPKPGERWLLVTSAEHMPRAIGCFRRVGFPVEAYPVDWRTFPRWRFRLSTTFARGLRRTDRAVHEWLGLLVYWLSGRTSELLPGPRAR